MSTAKETNFKARRVAIMGDVHLGRGDARTGYGGSEEELVGFLRWLRGRADRVVVNGDLFDLDRGTLPLRFEAEYARARSRWPLVVSTLDDIGAVWLVGNHDAALTAHDGLWTAASVELGPWRVRIEHGDRFDGWLKRQRTVTRLVTWASGRASRLGAGHLYDALRAGERLAAGEGGSAVHRRALRWLDAQERHDVLVVGHTHEQAALEVAGRWLFNAGDGTRLPFGFVVLDGDDDSWQLGQWYPDRVTTVAAGRLATGVDKLSGLP